MKKLKVIHIAHASHSYFANENDDLKKITLNDWYFKTARQMKKFYPEIVVECWCPERAYTHEEEWIEEGIRARFFPTLFSPLYGLDYAPSLIRALKEEVQKSKQERDYLVIHLHEFHSFHGLLIASLFKRENIIVQHHGGSWPVKHVRESIGKRKALPLFLLGQVWEEAVIKNVRQFYALSQPEIDYLQKRGCRVRFQTMGIDDEYFDSMDKKTARKKLKINEDEKIVLFLGRVSEIKGMMYLLEAAKSLPQIRFIIIGFGQEREYYEKKSKDMKLAHVQFLGGVFGEKKMHYLSAADALLLPSLKEGAPVTVMEALARNLPCVVSDVGGVRLMIEQGKNGIIIPPKNPGAIVDAIQEVIEWPYKNLHEYAKLYKWEKIIDDTVKDYERIAQKR